MKLERGGLGPFYEELLISFKNLYITQMKRSFWNKRSHD